jgi:hypothetical protein
MLKFGFDATWVSFIMACVSSVKYFVRFNSITTESFIPSRGIRQGDSLSPYLFLLCAEGLSSMMLMRIKMKNWWVLRYVERPL